MNNATRRYDISTTVIYRVLMEWMALFLLKLHIPVAASVSETYRWRSLPTSRTSVSSRSRTRGKRRLFSRLNFWALINLTKSSCWQMYPKTFLANIKVTKFCVISDVPVDAYLTIEKRIHTIDLLRASGAAPSGQKSFRL